MNVDAYLIKRNDPKMYFVRLRKPIEGTTIYKTPLTKRRADAVQDANDWAAENEVVIDRFIQR